MSASSSPWPAPGSSSRRRKRLRLDHATVSRRIAALEAGLGAQIVRAAHDRRAADVGGRAVLAAAEEMEIAFLHAQSEVSDVDVELTGEVRIGAPDGFSTYYLAGALRGLIERKPAFASSSCPLPQVSPLRGASSTSSSCSQARGRALRRPQAHRLQPRVYASAAYLAPKRRATRGRRLAGHRLIGYVEEHAFSSALSYVRELWRLPDAIECASAVTQFEAVRAGLGLGVVHDYIARRFADLKRVLAERRAMRTYGLVVLEVTRGLGRIPPSATTSPQASPGIAQGSWSVALSVGFDVDRQPPCAPSAALGVKWPVSILPQSRQAPSASSA